MLNSNTLKEYLKINSKIFYHAADRYGLDMFNILHDSSNSYAEFTFLNCSDDIHTINVIKKLLSVILNSPVLSDEEIKSKFDNKEIWITGAEYDEDKSIDIYTLLLAFVDFMRDKYDAKHYTERLRSFYEENYVELSGSVPVVHWLKDNTFTFTPVVYMEQKIVITDSLIKKQTISPVSVRSEQKRAYYRNFDWNNLYNSCLLFRKFYNGDRYYSHAMLLLLARNICGAEKGKKLFLQIINYAENKDYNYRSKNWKEILNGIVKGNVPIQKCADCPYSSECCHSDNMLETASPKKHDIGIIKKAEYVSIEEAEQDLAKKFNQAVESDEKGIHIIKAQTGLGKTTAYINYLKNADKPCIIAVPTHNLKDEIFLKAIANGVKNICCTPALPESSISHEIVSIVNHLYAIGAGKEVIPYLAGILSKISKNSEDYIIIKDYLNASKKAVNFKGHIITTHAKFFMMSEENLYGHQIIIDEDILRQLYNTDYVSMNDIRKIAFSNSNLPETVLGKLRSFNYKKGYRYYDAVKELQHIDELNGTNSNILGLLNAEITYTDSEKVLFVDKKELPDMKIIIMSATIDAKLYSKFFPGRKIFSYECKKAQYKGKIIQHTDLSYSRAALQKNDSIIPQLKRIAKGNPVITFQSIEARFDTQYHFGNVEGLNILEGKDLFVIGLPNLPEEIYILYGICAGIEPGKNKMRPQRVEYNNYSFYLNTFDNQILRRIQMWILSSQLEQSTGRARLLRNDCTVEVFSGFPVEQAIFQK